MIPVSKLREVMNRISREKGEFTLFGLFLREEAPDRWDLVLSAPWLEKGKMRALREFVKTLSAVVGKEELLSLSRIVTLNRRDPALAAILQAVPVTNGPVEVKNRDFSGLAIRQGLILKAKPRRTKHVAAT